PKFEENNAVILGVSPDTPERLAEWREAENLPYSLLSDPDHAVAEQYASWGEKSMYGKKYMGVIRSHFLIDVDGKFEDVQIKISPKKSIEKAVKAVAN
ncbi:MAG: redoxin domain-containing protein, partial [Chloroflexota bacterium]